MKIICAVVGEVSKVFLFFFFLGKLWELKNHRQCTLVWLVLDLVEHFGNIIKNLVKHGFKLHSVNI